MKNFFEKLKELWKHPRYKSLMKLGLYFLIVVIAFGLLTLGKLTSEPVKYTEPKTPLENYLEMKNYEYTYDIKYQKKNQTINQMFNGTKYEDINEFKYLNKKYYILSDNIYNKETNEIVNNLTEFNLLYLEPNSIVELITSVDVKESITKYNDSNSKKEYVINFDGSIIYITIFEEDNYIVKVNLDVTDMVKKTSKDITSYIVEINYSNINNISSYN